MASEPNVIANDILYYLDHNYATNTKEKLIKVMSSYYCEEAVKDSLGILFKCFPSGKSTRHLRKIQNKNPFVALYETFKFLPDCKKPAFACQNINNFPGIDYKFIKQETENMPNEIELTKSSVYSYDNEKNEIVSLKEDQQWIRDKLSSMTNELKHLQSSVECLSKETPLEKTPCSNSKFEIPITKRKKKEKICKLQPINSKISDESSEFLIVDNIFDENIGHFSIYRCFSCNYSTNEEEMIRDHKCQNESSNQYTCSFCDHKERSLTLFNDHLRIHKRKVLELEYECVLCSYQTDEKEQYRNHLCTHSWKKPFKCGSCTFRTNYEFRMKNHMISHSEYTYEGRYECSLCGRVCGARDAHDKHKRMHMRNLEHACGYCGISFATLGALHFHLLSHTKENAFVCRFCDHSSHSQHYILKHEMAHSKKKDYTCHVCGKVLANRLTLRMHVIHQHAGIKDFQCDLCDDAFVFQRELDSHKRKIHTEYHEFKCDHCHKTYKNKTYYELHIETHNNKNI